MGDGASGGRRTVRRSPSVLPAAVLLLAAARGPAQTPPPPGPGTADRVTADLKDVEIREEEGSRVFLFHRRVEIVRGEVFLKADSMVGWIHPKPEGGTPEEAPSSETPSPRPPPASPPSPVPGYGGPPEAPAKGGATSALPDSFDEIYAEGHVLFRAGNREVQSARLYYDFRTSRGMVLDFQLESTNPRTGGTLFLRGDRGEIWVQAHRVREFSRLHLESQDCTITGCEFARPHYALKAGEVAYDSAMEWFELKRVQTTLLGIPVFYWPLSLGMNTDRKPFLRSVSYQRSSRFGDAVYGTLGMQLFLQEQAERIAPGEEPVPQKLTEWGDLEWHSDWRSKRGMGYGSDLHYQQEDYGGYITGYYTQDRGPDPDIAYERQFLPLADDDRWRFRSFHRQDFLAHWRFEAESSYISDRNFLREFFEQEFKEEKEQETTGYVRFLRDNKGGTLRGRVRLNEFQTQNEYLPQLRTHVYSEPVLPAHLANVYVTNVSEVSNVRRRIDTKLALPEPEVWRFDTDTVLQVPLGLGPVQISSFAGGRYGVFERGASGSDRLDRIVGYAGVRASTEWAAVYDIDWDLVGLHGLRHVTDLEGWYTLNYECSVAPEDLNRMDDLEEASRYKEVALEWRHRFQTRTRGAKPGDPAVEFLSLGAGIEYYPDASRDTTRPRRTSVLIPFHWITVSPDPAGVLPERDASNLFWNVRFTPAQFLQAEVRGEFNPNTRVGENVYAEVGVVPSPWLTLNANDFYERGVTHAIGVDALARLGDRWTVEAYRQWDLRTDLAIYSRYSVIRDLHDFLLSILVEVDEGQDDVRFGVSLSPKFLGRAVGSSLVGTPGQPGYR